MLPAEKNILIQASEGESLSIWFDWARRLRDTRNSAPSVMYPVGASSLNLPVIRIVAAVLLAACSMSGADTRFFETKVRPLLAAKCLACHAESQMSGLRLDSLERALQGGTRGPAIAPGDPDGSLLLTAVRRSRSDLKMPPTESLGLDEIAVLEEWIAAGATWPDASEAGPEAPKLGPEAREFWAFKPVRKPAVPGERGREGAIDAFLAAKLQAKGLEPAPPAGKRTLIRRATLGLLGLPPTPREVASFLSDDSPEAYPRLVDRLLKSPHYGERMARRWLDLARYADGLSAAYADTPLTNAWRYRDWVVNAFNQDLPFDKFAVAQLAADLLPEGDREGNLPALGFHALRDRDDDRVEVTGRVFLGLTIGCAQCHDHKFDPIPQTDYYALQGVFDSTEAYQHPLAPSAKVDEHDSAKKKVSQQKLAIELFLEEERDQLIDVLMESSAEFLMASYRVFAEGGDPSRIATEKGLDLETLERWIAYLESRPHEHPYLEAWHRLVDRGGSLEEARREAADFERVLLGIHRDKRAVDDRNYVKLGGAEGARTSKVLLNTNLEFLEPVRYYLWRDMATPPGKKRGLPFAGGIYYYGEKDIERFLGGVWLRHLEIQRAELKRLEAEVPPPYPFLHAYRDSDTPKDARLAIRGDKKNLGTAVARRFLAVLTDGEPVPFSNGSGRLELARAISSPRNPLTARVFVNRLWQWRFGRGLVSTSSNFGQLGERPTHPELLDWLAAEFVDSGWSVKALDRRILLSAAYRRSSEILAVNQEIDADNRFLWRFNPVQRLDAETLRDAMLSVSGELDLSKGGVPTAFEDGHFRRAVYAKVDRTNPDPFMALFDFPDAKSHSATRDTTVGPLQRLYLINNPFVIERSGALAGRLLHDAGISVEARIRRAYDLLYSRQPTDREIADASAYLESDGWEQYCQVLLASSEFLTVR